MHLKPTLLAFVIVLIISACTRPKDLEYVDFQNFKVLEMGLQESRVGMHIRFFNPNNQRAQLKDARADVYINNIYLGKTQIDSLIQIPKRDTFAVPIVLRVGTLAAATNILQSLGDSSALIRLEGNAKLGKAGIFKDYPIKFEGRRKIEL